MRALCRASRRGAEVSLYIPRSSDKYLVDLAAESYFAELLRARVKIYRGGGPFNHTKAGTIDGVWATLGSLNLDFVSLRYNFEGNIVTNDSGFISKIDTHFADDCKSAELLTASAWHRRPLYRKVLHICILPLRFLL